MKILYDHQIFDNQIYGGISRYFYNLMDQFSSNEVVNFNLSLIYSHNVYLNGANFKNPIRFLKNKKFKGRDRLLACFLNLNKIYSSYKLKYSSYDIFHPTEYDSYFLNYIENRPFVLTVYDMVHEIFYSQSSLGYIENKRELIKKARKIIAITENTKKDILKFVDVSAQKIEVIHLASNFKTIGSNKIYLPEKFLLFVGNRGGYKNFSFFLKSVIPTLKKNRDLFLVCVGGRFFTEDEMEIIKLYNLKDKIFHFNLTDPQLVYAYSQALAFVFPSLYEGFGIPILEAFSCGCPAIISESSCFPEVAQDAAFYFNPSNSDSIQEIIEKVLMDSNLRKNIIRKGFLRLKDFSWERSAEETLKVYKDII